MTDLDRLTLMGELFDSCAVIYTEEFKYESINSILELIIVTFKACPRLYLFRYCSAFTCIPLPVLQCLHVYTASGTAVPSRVNLFRYCSALTCIPLPVLQCLHVYIATGTAVPSRVFFHIVTESFMK